MGFLSSRTSERPVYVSSSSTARHLEPALSDPIAPALSFYAWKGVEPPHFEMIAGDHIPEPYRSLLVHDRDMTPTLQDHYQCSIHLRVLYCDVKDGILTRYVNLLTDDGEELVEFGAIMIDLGLLDIEPRLQVIGGYIPFGGILYRHGIPHSSHPSCFFRVKAESVMSETLALEDEAILFGRCNTISLPGGTPLAHVVEILPPSPQSPQSNSNE